MPFTTCLPVLCFSSIKLPVILNMSCQLALLPIGMSSSFPTSFCCVTICLSNLSLDVLFFLITMSCYIANIHRHVNTIESKVHVLFISVTGLLIRPGHITGTQMFAELS